MGAKSINLSLLFALFCSANSSAQWTQVNYGLADTTLHQDDLFIVSFTDCINVHTGPSVTDSILWCAPAGYAGQIMGTSAVPDEHGSSNLTFWLVRFDNVLGWCASKYLHKTNLQIPNVNVLAASGTTLIAGTNTGDVYVYRSTDNGASWGAANAGLEGYSLQSLTVYGTTLYAGTYNGIYQSTNGGMNWTSIGLVDSSIEGVAASPTCLFAETATATYRSSNNGTTWSSFTWSNFGAIIDTNLFQVHYNGQIDISTDNGTTWNMIHASYPFADAAWNFCVSGRDVFDFLASAESEDQSCLFGLYWTGNSFVNATMNFPPSYLSCAYGVAARIVTSGPNNVALYYSSDFFSTNCGLDWKVITWPSGIIRPNVFVTLGSNIFVAGAGIWKNSLDNALPIQLATFKAVAIGNKEVSLNWTTASETNNYGFYVQRNGADITFIPGNGTTLQQHTYSYTDNPAPGQYQYRLRQVDLDGTSSFSEKISVGVSAPQKFALAKNYPNPFNPSTRITFSITKEGPVSLQIYDILGREVATLVNENRKAGQYTEQFNGNQTASGVYMYVLKSAEGQLVGRMMLLK